MSSSESSSHSPGEEAYHTAEEDHQLHKQGSSVASSTITTALDGGSNSVYATANQTPTDIDTFTSPLDSPTGEAPDESSCHWRPQIVPDVNDSQALSPEYTSREKYLEHRGASEVSYTYRPTPIDVESQQQITSPSTPPPSINNNTLPSTTNRATDNLQELESIEEDKMPYDPSGKFIMNPTAPVFVPRQQDQPAMKPYNPRDWVRFGAPAPKPGKIDEINPTPTSTPNLAPKLPKVPLFGSGHGMFFDPNTGLFTGDGAPRKSPYRPDGTLPSRPDLESDRLTKQQYPEPAEDQLHILPQREYAKRMEKFGKDGQITRFTIDRPAPLGYQQGTRVMVGQGTPLGRRVQTDHETDAEGSLFGRRVQTDHEPDEYGGLFGPHVHPGNQTESEGSLFGHRTHTTGSQEEEEISMSGHGPHALEELRAQMHKKAGGGSQDWMGRGGG